MDKAIYEGRDVSISDCRRPWFLQVLPTQTRRNSITITCDDIIYERWVWMQG